MNYSEELLNSFLWILKAMASTAVLFSLTVYILAKTTRWGHQFWVLAAGYITPKRSLSPLIYFSIIVFFNLSFASSSVTPSSCAPAIFR